MTHAHNLSPAEDRAPAPETTVVDSTRVWCDGSGGIRPCATVRPAALGHPRVWLEIDESGFADCGYCDRRFVLKGGPADDPTGGPTHSGAA